MNRKLFIVTAAAVSTVILVLLVTLRMSILRGFEEVEEQQVLRNIERVRAIVQDDLSDIEKTVTDWSTWDEAYAFLAGSNPSFVSRNLTAETFVYLKTDLIAYTARDGRILFGRQLDGEGKTLLPIQSSLPRQLRACAQALLNPDNTKSLTGVLVLPEGPFLISFQNVVDSRGSGPSRGFLFMGRRLSKEVIAEYSRISHSSIVMEPITKVPPELAANLAKLPPGAVPSLVKAIDGSRSEGYSLIRDIFGAPALQVKLSFQRAVYQKGKEAIRYFILWITGITLLATLAGAALYRKLAKAQQEKADALRTAKEDLETRVAARTAELSAANKHLQRDIEDRIRVEEALRKAETIQRITFEAIPDMLTVIDRDLRIVKSNWRGGYGYVPTELREANPYCYDAFYPGRGEPCNPCHVLETFSTGNPVYSEKINPRIGHVEIRVYPIFDESGQVVLAVEHIRDITERKKMEEERIKAQKLQSVGVLAGGIAHDFNNLLTGILGNISLARELAKPDSTLAKRLEAAEKAIQRAGDLTQQLLTFSRGGAPVRKSAAISQLAMDSVSFALRGSNVNCAASFPEDLWPAEVDAGQINQVFNNLLINAGQAMPDGGTVSIRAENMLVEPEDLPPLAEGRYVRVSVTDTGTGIPKSILGRIFDPYFTTKPKGNGLGLATCYSIIEKHEGLITVESEVGRGTTFHIYLPAAGREPDEIALENRPQPSGTGRILVMDDEEVIREVAGEILAHLGYEAVLCRDGAEALALYRDAAATGEPFAAVLVDLTIPGGMGGRETMQRLLAIDPAVTGIVSSGYSNDPILSLYAEYGFRAVVLKPYTMEDLGRTLQEVLSPGTAHH